MRAIALCGNTICYFYLYAAEMCGLGRSGRFSSLSLPPLFLRRSFKYVFTRCLGRIGLGEHGATTLADVLLATLH